MSRLIAKYFMFDNPNLSEDIEVMSDSLSQVRIAPHKIDYGKPGATGFATEKIPVKFETFEEAPGVLATIGADVEYHQEYDEKEFFNALIPQLRFGVMDIGTTDYIKSLVSQDLLPGYRKLAFETNTKLINDMQYMGIGLVVGGLDEIPINAFTCFVPAFKTDSVEFEIKDAIKMIDLSNIQDPGLRIHMGDKCLKVDIKGWEGPQESMDAYSQKVVGDCTCIPSTGLKGVDMPRSQEDVAKFREQIAVYLSQGAETKDAPRINMSIEDLF